MKKVVVSEHTAAFMASHALGEAVEALLDANMETDRESLRRWLEQAISSHPSALKRPIYEAALQRLSSPGARTDA